MTVEELETLILFLGGEVPNTNKGGKETLAETLCREFLTAKGIECQMMPLDEMAAQIEALTAHAPQGNTTGQGGEAKDIKTQRVSLPHSVGIEYQGKEMALAAGPHDLPLAVIAEIKAAGIKVTVNK